MKKTVITLIYRLVEETDDIAKEKISYELTSRMPSLRVLPHINKGVEKSRFVITIQDFLDNPDSLHRDRLLLLAEEIQNKFEDSD